ncbi:MAG: hypothetical protein WAM28_03395, partial [Chlamydiales bacterium]
YKQLLPEQKHTFTRYRAFLRPHLLVALKPGEGHLWKERKELDRLPFSAGHRKILAELKF